MWHNNHGADKLYDKFWVYSVSKEDWLGYDGEFMMTLRPEADYEAWLALHEYANRVKRRSPRLAAEIHERLADILRGQMSR